MLYSEVSAVCSQIHTKHINKLCGQNVGFLLVQKVVRIVTTVLYRHQQKPVAVKNAEPLGIVAASSSACSSTKNGAELHARCYSVVTMQIPHLLLYMPVEWTDGRMEIVLFFF